MGPCAESANKQTHKNLNQGSYASNCPSKVKEMETTALEQQLKNKSEIKTFAGKQKLREFITIRRHIKK